MELYSTCISHDWESELNMYIDLHLREEVLWGSLYSRELEDFYQLMDNIIYLYQRKTWKSIFNPSKKISKDKS